MEVDMAVPAVLPMVHQRTLQAQHLDINFYHCYSDGGRQEQSANILYISFFCPYPLKSVRIMSSLQAWELDRKDLLKLQKKKIF